jgi:hypothetical protein
MTVQQTNPYSQDQQAALTNQRVLAKIAPMMGQFTQPNTKRNVYNLAGEYVGTTFKVPVVLHACAPTYLRATTFDHQAVINRVEFTEQVTLTPNARAIFNGCIFQQPVVMQSGAKAAFNGCQFLNQANVQNAGLAADAGILGCESPVAHVNVTTIFSI